MAKNRTQTYTTGDHDRETAALTPVPSSGHLASANAPAPAALAPEPTLEQWRAYAADLQRQLADAQAVIAGYEARAPKQTFCFSPPGAAIAWRIPAVSLERARAALPPEAAGAMYRGVA